MKRQPVQAVGGAYVERRHSRVSRMIAMWAMAQGLASRLRRILPPGVRSTDPGVIRFSRRIASGQCSVVAGRGGVRIE